MIMDDDPPFPESQAALTDALSPHPTVLMIARLLGRQLAREAFEARKAANDNPIKPRD